MGYTRHHCIIIMGNEKVLTKVRKIAKEIFDPRMVSPVMHSPANCTHSLYIAPDGSNDGWEMSNEYNEKRLFFYHELPQFYPEIYYVMEVEIDGCGEHTVTEIEKRRL